MAGTERGYHSEFSAYGGHAIETDSPGAETLAALGITDHEQLTAALAIPSVRPYIEDALSEAGVDVATVTAATQDAIPAAALAPFEAPATLGVLALGAMEPDDAIRAEIASLETLPPFAAGEAVSLPASVNFSKQMPPIRQQGSRGTCVAFTLTAAHEYWRIASGVSVDLSEQFLYHRIKQMDGSPNGCGTWQVKGAQVLSTIGECREATWPYNPNPPCNNNGVQPGNAAADAASYKITPVVLNSKDVNAIKGALAGGSCVGFSLAVYNSWYQSAYVRQTGRINMRVGNEPSVGGHALCCIGYQDDAAQPGGGVFILRNHWGTGWGTQCPYGAGNGTIPYAYIANEGWEAVAMPPPRRRFIPRPWVLDEKKRVWPFDPAQDGEDGDSENGRTTLFIDTQGKFDIVIR